MTAVAPHGGPLVDLLVPAERGRELRGAAARWPSWHLTRRQLCDLELVACGGFSPLVGFLGRDDHLSVCHSMRLANGVLWPVPVTLDVSDAVLAGAGPAGRLALRDPDGALLAVLRVEEVWRPDLRAEAAAVFGTTDPTHPGVEHLLHATHRSYVTGRLEVVRLPEHAAFRQFRRTPAQLRREFADRRWRRVVAFQTRNPMHRAHQELTLRAAAAADANLLIHPVVGVTKPGDVDPYTRVRCYRALLPTYPEGTAVLSLLPLAMRMAGPREALWHAIIRQNYGATHFIVGRDHAGPGPDRDGRPFYPPYAAHDLVARHAHELGVRILPFQRMVYLPDRAEYVAEQDAPPGARTFSLSGTQLRQRLAEGAELPGWFTRQEVAAELRRTFPPRREQGLVVFLTGLAGAGKSAIAKRFHALLCERGDRRVTLLDGELVRQLLPDGPRGAGAEHDLDVRRIGLLAAEVARNRGIAVCAPVAPRDAGRRAVRRMVEPGGAFVLVHVATPIEVCEQRDDRGRYARARAGLLPRLAGVSQPYEPPTDADLVVDARFEPPERAAGRIVDLLHERGFLPAPGDGAAAPAGTGPAPVPRGRPRAAQVGREPLPSLGVSHVP